MNFTCVSLVERLSIEIFKFFNGRYQNNWARVCRTLSKTLNVYLRPLCDFPNPNYDLTKSLILHLRSNSEINTLFQACLIISSLELTDAKGNVKSLCG